MDSAYSSFFASGFMSSGYEEQLKSFISFDANEAPLPPARPESRSCLPAAPALAPAPKLSSHSVSRTPSTVSTNYRRVKRSDALARLEGKASKQPSLAYDFMELDDDDEDEGDDEMSSTSSTSSSTSSVFSSDDDSESFIELPPRSTRGHGHSASSPISPPPSFFSSESRIRSISSRTKHSSVSSRGPLTSFIDLKDEDSIRWRSFIEISIS
ncbi:hypothetical protein CYLTODRAFT_453613 [Cylindrobasidium torrendii FP15055 ss-10]|uniref:Uncharacterized protein n=1 Tax=Cylindrobasidium torrendii FP15055 ss-10 TaxID=1314674 RepID=A0A0D7BDV9_9AGAR|nr:hypothetical protein CYLTODRAFT_453613 [Cylindrobasidium torrendii FP15055 ss-10]